jgi:ABC-type sulfate/molybdate transport systems ATPase subunit
MTLQVHARHRLGALELDARFEVPPGVTALVGPSGAGKTSVLRIIAGLERSAESWVSVEGVEWQRPGARPWPAARREVGFVFQSLALFPHLTALENVAFGRRGDPGQWLERLKVAHLAHRRPASFSGGEAQRVALARALARAPKVLLLDEPFSSLDRPLRGTLLEALAAVVRETKVPTLLVTHDPDEATALGATVLRLEGGRVASAAQPQR